MSATSLLIGDIQSKLTSSVGITFIILGTIGNVLNIVLFRRRALWTLSPSIPYLLAASVANIIIIYPFAILRVLIGFNITPTYFSSPVCRLQIYLYYVPTSLSSWFMVGCCADRFYSSSRSAVVRRYSCMLMTRRIIIVTTTIIVVVYFQTLDCFEANQFYKSLPCNTLNDVCSVIDIVYYFIFQTVGPPVFMLIFGIGTFIHIRQGRHIQQRQMNMVVVNSTTAISTVTTKMRPNNQTILPLLFTQITIYILCSIPLLAIKIYLLISVSVVKNDVRRSAETLSLSMLIWFSLVDKIFSFYIYTLTSKYFRQEFIKLMTKYRRQRRVAPQN
jgi:hypothetical protein